MRNRLIELVESSSIKEAPPKFQVGDTVEVQQKILEGEKTRIQSFEGVVISRRGTGSQQMFTVRRIVQGEGVERVFPLHSPLIADVIVKRMGRVRRAKLYYLRDRVGKSARIKERRPKAAELAAAKKTKIRRKKKKKAPAAEE